MALDLDLRYISRIKLAPAYDTALGAEAVLMPVDSIDIRPMPVTRRGGGTVKKLIGNRKKFIVPTWGYEVNLAWSELKQHYSLLAELVDLLIATPYEDDLNLYVAETPVDLTTGTPNPFSESYKIPAVIADLDKDTLTAEFRKRFRYGHGSLKLVTKSDNYETRLDWLTD
jgi:hypothetical protein